MSLKQKNFKGVNLTKYMPDLFNKIYKEILKSTNKHSNNNKHGSKTQYC